MSDPQVDIESNRRLHPRLREYALANVDDRYLSDAERIRDDLRIAMPELELSIAEVNGLWSLRSDNSAASWLIYDGDPQDISSFACFIENLDEETRAKA